MKSLSGCHPTSMPVMWYCGRTFSCCLSLRSSESSSESQSVSESVSHSVSDVAQERVEKTPWVSAGFVVNCMDTV